MEDLPLIVYQCTWSRSKGTENAVEERLDRAMMMPRWSELFLNAKLLNLVAPVSDHTPILVYSDPAVVMRRQRTFRFENKWLQEPDLRSIMIGVGVFGICRSSIDFMQQLIL